MTQDKLIEAAKAVIARWDTPRWKDAKHTADYIYSLRDAVNAAELASQAQPIPSQSDDEPVAWISFDTVTRKEFIQRLPIQSIQPGVYKHIPLYTKPQPARD